MLTISSLYHQHRPWMFYLTKLRAYLFYCSKHPVSVPRWGLLNSPRKISNFQKFFEVRPRSKFPTGEKTKPTEEKTKPTGQKTKPPGRKQNPPGIIWESCVEKLTNKLCWFYKKFTQICSYMYIYIPGWPKTERWHGSTIKC